ncbi:phosphatase PAP2 family protein [Microlunatus ginsengisoli]
MTIHAAAVGMRRPATSVAATAITSLGTFPLLVGLAAAAAAGMWLQTRRIDRSAMLLLGLATVAGTVFLLKIAVARHRPPTTALLGSPSWDYAFPSGHTANGTVTWMLVAVLLTADLARWARRAAVIAGCLVSVAIGLSRVYLGYHWMTDVIAGWLIATLIICLALYLGRAGVIDWITFRTMLNGRTSFPDLDPSDRDVVSEPSTQIAASRQLSGEPPRPAPDHTPRPADPAPRDGS